MHPQSGDDGAGTLGSAAPRHQCTRFGINQALQLRWTTQLRAADYILQVRSELEKVAQVEGVDSLAVAAAGCRQVQCVVNEAARPSFFGGLLQHGLVLRRTELDNMEVGRYFARSRQASPG